MTNEQDVKQEYRLAKCVYRDGVYMVLAWDAFFAVGPLLGQGRTRDEAWASVRLPIRVTPAIALAVMDAEGWSRRYRGKRKVRR